MNALLKGIGFGIGFGAALIGGVAIASYFVDVPGEDKPDNANPTDGDAEPVQPEQEAQ